MSDIKIFQVGDDIVKDLKHYSLRVANTVDTNGEPILAYQVTNEHTGVVEVEMLMLPEAVNMVKHLEDWYVKFEEGESLFALPPTKEIITH